MGSLARREGQHLSTYTIFCLWDNMSKKVDLKCFTCKCSFQKEKKEYTRRIKLGKIEQFCSLSCAAVFNNRHIKKPDPVKTNCLHCKKVFLPIKHKSNYTTKFCSRSCASAGSITELRIEKRKLGGLNSYNKHGHKYLLRSDDVLKKREAWKYENLKNKLDSKNIKYEFEYRLEKYVFDLFLPDFKLFIEFDARYHNSPKQQEIDRLKTELAKKQGFKVARMKTESNVVIPHKPVIRFIERFL